MKKIKLLIFMMVIVICPEVKAECDYNLNLSLANNIQYSYDFFENPYSNYFTLTLTNLQNNFYVMDSENRSYEGYDEVNIPSLEPGKTYYFDIYSKDSECSYSSIRTIEVELPYYNKFYKESICQNMNDFKYCNKWTYVDLTYEELLQKIEENQNVVVENTDDSIGISSTKKIADFILKVYSKSYFIVLPILIAVLIYNIYKLDKKDNIL